MVEEARRSAAAVRAGAVDRAEALKSAKLKETEEALALAAIEEEKWAEVELFKAGAEASRLVEVLKGRAEARRQEAVKAAIGVILGAVDDRADDKGPDNRAQVRPRRVR